MSFDEEETLEDYLHKRLTTNAEVFIYERDHPIISNEMLKHCFGNVAFIQYANLSTDGQWNVVLFNNRDNNEDSLKQMLSEFCGFQLDKEKERLFRSGIAIRLGSLKCLFSETFNPFQETMKRLLELDPIKKWLRKTIDNNSKSRIIASFLHGQLIAIL